MTSAASNQSHGYIAERSAVVKRLHRIEGQVRGIEKMVDEERPCVDILTQIAAVTTALQSVAHKLLSDHVTHCVAGVLEAGDPAVAREKSEELLAAVERFSKAL